MYFDWVYWSYRLKRVFINRKIIMCSISQHGGSVSCNSALYSSQNPLGKIEPLARLSKDESLILGILTTVDNFSSVNSLQVLKQSSFVGLCALKHFLTKPLKVSNDGNSLQW